MVQGIDVEIAKVDPARRAWSLACKNDFGIGKDVMEEIKLDVFTSEWLGIVTLYRQSLSTEITNTGHQINGVIEYGGGQERTEGRGHRASPSAG